MAAQPPQSQPGLLGKLETPTDMKQQLATIFLLSLLAGSVPAQSVDQKIEKIRKLYAEVAEEVEQADKDPVEGSVKRGLVMNELTINKNNRVWAAVGTFRVTYKFYYEGGDAAPEPDRLVMVSVHSQHAGRFLTDEYLVGEDGSLLFYFAKANRDGPHEQRVYFSNGKAIRVIEDEKARDKLTEEDAKHARSIRGRWSEIRKLFEISNNDWHGGK